MFEYQKIKTELEEVKCPAHGKKATVSFDNGKMVVETSCCEAHKVLLNRLLSDVSQKNISDIIAEVF
ncbi:MAG: hypothetical protein V4615_15350 [Bacteroidota bacterium]